MDNQLFNMEINEKFNMKLFVIVIIAFFFIISCEEPKELWVDCQTNLDTTWILNEQERGGWFVNDSLILSAGIQPYDKSLCDSIGIRSLTLWTPSGKSRPCSLGDLFPPFQIYKKAWNDSLFVLQDNMVILFQIPKHLCN
ncbi:hypothetical protein DN752_21400 [Echinicola strongylocentroti]|uniref:Uncharacterized protein n=1 Tax=Echinicola strongylocentroti TaxID=1795355 RepID=A0A2Z4IPD6_9BACT|nr:hypothetical protein [Echinicola strongylocentroti]AWW32498.1 hypothetical protein DN752_21400 [Echinicola strongylocentroti]